MYQGRILKSGGKELADKLDQERSCELCHSLLPCAGVSVRVVLSSSLSPLELIAHCCQEGYDWILKTAA